MNTFLYLIIFITGIFFGSFFTLAVYRIPRKEDILIKHSYCPNCDHKLGFFDLFPILSYILLGGKCRYCKKKIKPRYLILEICAGITFVLIAISKNITQITVTSYISLIMEMLYVSILFIIIGIDKEKVLIQKNVLFVGYIFEIIYMIYQYTLCHINVYQYVIYLLLFIILLLVDNIMLKFTLKNKYYTDILYLIFYIIIYCGSKIYIISTILTLLTIVLYSIIKKIDKKNISVGFFLGICNIVTIIILNFLTNYFYYL